MHSSTDDTDDAKVGQRSWVSLIEVTVAQCSTSGGDRAASGTDCLTGRVDRAEVLSGR